MKYEDLLIIRSCKILMYIRIMAWRARSLTANQSGKAGQALGVPRKRPCGIFRRFVCSRCEHAATRL